MIPPYWNIWEAKRNSKKKKNYLHQLLAEMRL